jgi:predicted Zn-dependent peptidase
VTASHARPVPALGKPRPVKLPTVADVTLDTGLRVLAVRRPGVPLVELRLRIPFAGKSGAGQTHGARATLLSETLLAGTERHDASGIAVLLQSLGGQLHAGTDADRLSLSGSVLTSGWTGLLDLLGEVLTAAAYPAEEVAAERDRVVQELAIYRSQPGVVAREALLARMYGDHPYGRELPDAEAVQEVTAGQLLRLHRKRVAPAGSILTVVGDVQPRTVVRQVEQALGAWTAASGARRTPKLPEPPAGGPVLLVDRPGAVQTTIRMAGAAPSRTSDDYAALSLANMVFGGYFSSRWVANIREDKGYTYSPHSVFEHPPAGSRLALSADVATPVTAPALLETLYELGRVATVPVDGEELERARRYAIGSLQLSTASQGGLASTLSMLAGVGLGVEYLRDYPKQLAAVTADEVLEAAARWLAPRRLTTVLVGDTSVVADSLGSLVEVERA